MDSNELFVTVIIMSLEIITAAERLCCFVFVLLLCVFVCLGFFLGGGLACFAVYRSFNYNLEVTR